MTASPQKDGAEKYKDLSIEELQKECKKRELSFDETSSKDELMALLVKDDHKPTDWAKIYARLLYHTGMHYEEIGRRTLPQISALLEEAGENIAIKVGMPNIFGDGAPIGNISDESPSSQEDVDSFFNDF